MPVEDLQILGTDNPATPSYQSPRGASLEAYLASAAANDAKADWCSRQGMTSSARSAPCTGNLQADARSISRGLATLVSHVTTLREPEGGGVQGPTARVTMGGFLALDRPHQRVLFWS